MMRPPVRHTRLEDDEKIVRVGEFDIVQTAKHHVAKDFVKLVVAACTIGILVALVSPDSFPVVAPLLFLNVALLVPLLIMYYRRAIRQQRVVLTDTTLLITSSSMCRTNEREFYLHNIRLSFTTCDCLQQCLDIDELHLTTTAGDKVAVVGLRNSARFLLALQQQQDVGGDDVEAGGPSDGKGRVSPAPVEMSLRDKAAAHSIREDARVLDQLNRLEDLSVEQLDALDAKIARMDERLDKIGASIAADKQNGDQRVDEDEDGGLGLVDDDNEGEGSV